MIKHIFLLLLAVTIGSCSEENDPTTNTDKSRITEYQALECLGDVTKSTVNADCYTTDDFDNAFCEIFQLGEYKITDQTISSAPQYCIPENGEITYLGSNGSTQKFIIDYKNYRSDYRFGVNDADCDTLAGYLNAYCFENVSINFSLKSQSNDYSFYCSFDLLIDFYNIDESGFFTVADYLDIYRVTPDASLKDFVIQIDQRTSDRDGLYDQEFYESIEIVGTPFESVHSRKPSLYDEDTFTYYYNARYGLVGFTDLDGITWRLLEQ